MEAEWSVLSEYEKLRIHSLDVSPKAGKEAYGALLHHLIRIGEAKAARQRSQCSHDISQLGHHACVEAASHAILEQGRVFRSVGK